MFRRAPKYGVPEAAQVSSARTSPVATARRRSRVTSRARRHASATGMSIKTAGWCESVVERNPAAHRAPHDPSDGEAEAVRVASPRPRGFRVRPREAPDRQEHSVQVLEGHVSGNQRNIPYRAIKAAHKAHRSGMSLGEISRLIYQRYGYKSPAACANTLRRSFRHYGLPIRSSADQTRLMQRGKVCAGCGESFETRTPKCYTCYQRHSAYKRSGRPFIAPVCLGCGGSMDGKTAGCFRCYRRHLERARRKRASVRAGLGGLSRVPSRGGTTEAQSLEVAA